MPFAVHLRQTSCRQARLDKALQDRYNLDTSLIEACKASERVGDLLLKSEGEELSRVRDYAEDLIRKEYRSDTSQGIQQHFHTNHASRSNVPSTKAQW